MKSNTISVLETILPNTKPTPRRKASPKIAEFPNRFAGLNIPELLQRYVNRRRQRKPQGKFNPAIHYQVRSYIVGAHHRRRPIRRKETQIS